MVILNFTSNEFDSILMLYISGVAMRDYNRLLITENYAKLYNSIEDRYICTVLTVNFKDT